MPLYEYRCQSCGAKNEFLLSSADEQPVEVCAACGGRKFDRLMSCPSVRNGRGSDGPTGGSCPDGSCGIDSSSCGSGGCCGV